MKSKPLILISLLVLSILSLNIVLISAVGTYPSVDPSQVLFFHFNNDSSVGENYGVNNITYDYNYKGVNNG